MARRQATGQKYSVQLDKSVSSHLKLLKNRLAATKAEINSIEADIVTVTSPSVKRSPPAQRKQEVPRPKPPPVYALRQSPAAKTAATGKPGHVTTKPQGAGRLEGPGSGASAGRQKAPAKPMARTTSPPLPKKGLGAPQKRVPPSTQDAWRPTATERVSRIAAKPATSPRKPATKRPSAATGRKVGPFPFPVAAVDERYTMQKFLAAPQQQQRRRRDSPTVSGVSLMPETPSVTDVERLLQLDDRGPNVWLEFPVGVSAADDRAGYCVAGNESVEIVSLRRETGSGSRHRRIGESAGMTSATVETLPVTGRNGETTAENLADGTPTKDPDFESGTVPEDGKFPVMQSGISDYVEKLLRSDDVKTSAEVEIQTEESEDRKEPEIGDAGAGILIYIYVLLIH